MSSLSASCLLLSGIAANDFARVQTTRANKRRRAKPRDTALLIAEPDAAVATGPVSVRLEVATLALQGPACRAMQRAWRITAACVTLRKEVSPVGVS